MEMLRLREGKENYIGINQTELKTKNKSNERKKNETHYSK